MFTGLVKSQGTIRRVDQRGDCMMTIAMGEPFSANIGDSICCSGICLTVIKMDDNAFKVSLSAETMTRTTARDWSVGTTINLEPSLTVGESMGGHYVSGHVDGLARVVAVEKSGDSMIFEFEVPPHLSRFVAAKGSVTLDGVSLTVNSVKDLNDPVPKTFFSVNVIPHTAKVTSFGNLKIGDSVNLEIDMLARYVARLNEKKL